MESYERRGLELPWKTFVAALGGILLWLPAPAWALPIISVDLDPGLAGIQATRTVDLGDSFTVDLVFIGDGTAAFDSVTFNVGFNDGGAVLGLGTGGTPGSPTAGALAGTAPFSCLDAFGGGAVTPGGGLTSLALGPPIGFGNSSGTLGLLSLLGQPFTGGPIGSGNAYDILRLTLVANAVGSSSVAPARSPLPTSPALAITPLGGTPQEVPVVLVPATVTVRQAPPPAVIPEPGTLLLLGSGLAVLARRHSRRKTRPTDR